MIFSRNKRWISVGFFAVVAATCVIAPQTAKADVKIEPDGVMGQSVVDETIYDPAEDYVWLSSNIEAPAQFRACALAISILFLAKLSVATLS